MTKRSRLDLLMVERGLADSRSRAASLISSGKVLVDGTVASKPAFSCLEHCEIRIEGEDHPWVGRGGIKLAHALAHFGIEVKGMIALDVGASTGGFTDVLLTNGAKKVYAVDVGRDQLHEKIRNDDRVINLEGRDVRSLSLDDVDEPVDIVVCDVSFISITKALEGVSKFCNKNAVMVTLIKPQFEAGRENIGKNGLVKDPAIHEKVVDDVRQWLESIGWKFQGLTESPVKGGKSGNTEYLAFYRRSD